MLLIINPSKRITRSISETFYFMGILSYGATPQEGLSEISELYRAVLIVYPEEFPDITDYIQRLKRYKSNIPIFAICTEETSLLYSDIFDGVFPRNIFSPALAKNIIEFANEKKYAKIGDYRLAGINASIDLPTINYFYRTVKLTKTETMILRFLMRSYPLPMKSKTILKYAFRPSRAPDSSVIKTYVSIMNKKFEKDLDKRMITLVPKEGYLILTAEYLYKGKLV